MTAPLPGGAIDAHIHMYPPAAAADPVAWGRAHGEPAWTACVAPAGKRSIQGWADPERLMADMDEAGVQACVMLGWYWERQATCDLQNAFCLDLVRRYPARLFGFAAVQPSGGQASIDSLERALDCGFRGVGELLPPSKGYLMDDPWWRRVVEIAASRGVPMTFHATDPSAGPAAGPPTPLENFVRMARDYPQVTFILAHWGGGLAFRGSEDLPGNLFFDTAASPLLYEPGVFRKAVDRVGAERIIFGSDYPLMLYPRESREPGFVKFLKEVSEFGLSHAEREEILGANISRLLGPQRVQ